MQGAMLIRYALCALAFACGLCPASGDSSANVSPLAEPPDWRGLDSAQKALARAEFVDLLENVFARDAVTEPFIRVAADRAIIQRESGNNDRVYSLEFAPDTASVRAVPRYWTPAAARGPAPAGKPLDGATIALDPGHIGGEFARMEERWFVVGGGKPVTEGDMTLLVARLLEPRLQVLGARVVWVRPSAKPVTRQRPADLRGPARSLMQRGGATTIRETYSDPIDPLRANTVQFQSELLFYRASEIRARAAAVNRKLKPDLTVCLHFNAEGWGNPSEPELVDRSHLHLLVNGAYSRGELSLDDVRYEMLRRLTNRVYSEELALANAVAASMAAATGLPPYTYEGGNAFRAGDNPYVWVRNLLANRVYLNPVLYLEPYVMNSPEVYARIQAGDYEGTRLIAGAERESIFREYARGVVEGIAAHYAAARGGAR